MVLSVVSADLVVAGGLSSLVAVQWRRVCGCSLEKLGPEMRPSFTPDAPARLKITQCVAGQSEF